MAPALRSYPDDAEVGAVFAVVRVEVSRILTYFCSISKSSHTTYNKRVFKPCPISIPIWETATEPSV